jgi:hypothetical protein
MLTINEEQMESLAEAQSSRFEQQLLSYLTKRFPERCLALGRQAIDRFIHFEIEQAEKFDIRRQCDIAHYVMLMFMIWDGCDPITEFDWVLAIIERRSMQAAQRLMELQHACLTRK